MIQSSPVTSARGYPSGGPHPDAQPHGERRWRLLHRGIPAVIIAAIAFTAGVTVGAGHEPGEQAIANRFVSAWERGDLPAMHALLTDAARARTGLEGFERAYRSAAATATATRIRAHAARKPSGGMVPIRVEVRTRLFGTVRADLRLKVSEEGGEARVAWDAHHVFPGLRAGERLDRTTRLPTRATLLAADGTVLARGDDRATEDAALSSSIGGALGPIPEARALELRAEGVPPEAQVGVTGLERALDDRLRGTPGGELRAGNRTLAVSAPRPADPVRTTIQPRVQRAAVAALGGRLGGVVALDPRSGAVRAAAGIGLSGLQPPGSTFKIVTLAGALSAGKAKMRDRFPVQTETALEGVRLENANGESCGGTLTESFAHSCNTVFAPLGAELGARRLVEVAERFGFNAPPGIDGAATSTIPPAEEIGDDLAVGSSAIGQGRVHATALQMAIVAATIALDGRRPVPTFEAAAAREAAGGKPRLVIPEDVARQIGRAMRAVVRYGTGTAAAIPGVTVAGKTGTAELRTTVAPDPGELAIAPEPENDPTDTDAWFSAYAPAGKPRIAVGMLLVEAGAGGDVAAPAARQVLAAALQR
jgi:cell division protein FtsI/penicillin-binding protein 2